MIATLSGTVAEKMGELVVVEVAGVGYGLSVTAEDYGRLAVGRPAKVYVYEHIREQQHDLFGFLDLDAKRLFEQLLAVNGVGPKMALSVMSLGTDAAVRTAIAGADTKFIQQAAGVGKRVAERIVVELKDKLGLEGVDLSSTGLMQSDSHLTRDEAVQALVSLGYSPVDAATAISGVDKSLPVEDRIRLALKGSVK